MLRYYFYAYFHKETLITNVNIKVYTK